MANNFLAGTAFIDANSDGTLGTGESYLAGATIQLQTPAGVVLATDVTDAKGGYFFGDQAPFATGVPTGNYKLVNLSAPGFAATSTQALSKISPVTATTSNSIDVTLADPADLKASINFSAFTLGRDLDYKIFGTLVQGSGGQLPLQLHSSIFSPNSTDPFLTLCTDVFNSLNGGANGPYVVTPDFVPLGSGSPHNGERIAYLYNQYGQSPQGATFDDQENNAAALQIAVWELLYDTVVDLDNGNFQVANFSPTDPPAVGTAVRARATALLADSSGKSEAAIFLNVLPPSPTVPTTTNRQGAIVTGSFNFGNKPVASLGDVVWNDLNANGKQDNLNQVGGEPGIPGVTVTLTDSSGNPVLNVHGAQVVPQVTDTSGGYLFTNLVVGTYKVTFSNLPTGYVFTTQDAGTNGFDSIDSDASTTTGITGTYTLLSGANNLTVDAGAYLPASLGNFVWNDLNGNGKQDGGEPGIDGVTATLTGTDGLGNAVNLSQITAGGGAYLFSNLVPGDYKVTFSNLPASYVFTAQDVGANGFDTVDSDADTATGATGIYTLVSGDNTLTVDAGAYLPASLGNFVWNDLNGNGKQDGGEPGIDGVTATLTGTDGLGNTVNVSQITAGGGAYLFSNLVPGDYKVTFSNLLSGYVFTAQDVGTNGFDAVDSDANAGTGATGTYTLVSGDSNLTVDAGAYLPASLGNFVWNDLNGNGKQDGGEPGIDGVTATLTGTDGLGNAVNLSQITAGGGAYLFSNLVPGDYKVTFSNLPAGYVFTAQDVGANGFDTVDSDANTGTGATGNYTLISGDNNLTVDAGAYLPASLGNFVWNDLNGNGKQDGGEPGIDGVTATLTGTDGSGNAVNLSQLTAGGGAYLFSNLVPGDYKVTFSNLPASYVFTAQDVGANGFDTVDSDADTATGATGTYTLVSGDNNLTVDAGAYLPASLGNFVWNDLNGNGKQDGGEPGIDGVTATLTGTDGLGNTVNVSQITAGGGAYLFNNLVPGDYKVIFSNLQSGYVFTAQNVSANGFDTVDSDANIVTGATGNYTLVSGDNNLTVDAGAYLPASLGNFVWNDLNGNGKQDGGEPGIDGVTATLTGTDGLGNTVNLSQITAGGGAYLFNNLVPGDYKVTFSTLPASYVFTAQDVNANGFDTVDSDANTTTGTTGNYTLVSGDNNLTVDAGAYLPASLGNFVWNDLNGNGKQDGDEPGIDGVTATLTGTDGLGNTVNLSQITAGGGAYLFSNLVPGDYKVTFSTLPSGYVFTAQDVGANGFDTVDSDADTATGATGTYTLVSGDNNLTVDAGAYLPASLGNFVWNDLNGNGKQDGGEPGIDGVTATLTGTDGLGNTVNVSQITAGGGAYLFNNLVPGDYKVTFSTLPSGYVFTAQDVGANGFDTVDSDANTGTGATGNYTLISGDNNLTVDAGAYLPASLGNFVWNDLNGNGKQDGGEPAIDGVTATLTGTDGLGNAVNLSQITAGGGAYLFNNLVPGSYKVTFSNLPGSYVFTAQDVGANGFDTVDSDANTATGATGNYTLVSGDSNLTVDAGAYLPASLGNFVWNDLNGNGKQDGGEPGIDGVTATLTGTDGLGNTVNVSQITAGGGAYLFNNLVPGDYKVTFSTLPSGYVFTAQDVGANGFDTVDSDANTGTGATGNYTLISGDNNLTVDAGAYLPASLGNFVWNDLNGNGKQDGGEPAIDGVTATLTGTDGLGNAVNLSQITAGGGAYLFNNLVPGSYKVTFSNLPGSYVFTAQDVGANGFDTVDSDANTATGATGNYTLVSGDSNLTVDAGAYLPASLGNFVWNDLNGNGKQDGGEPGIDGVTATLTGTDGLGNAVNLSQTTAGGGAYLFNNLVPGSYKVTFSNLPASYVFTAQDVGANGFDTVDSDANTATGATGNYTLVSGDSNLTVDAGAYLPASLGNFVWNDLNGNGKQDGGEPGINGVTAALTGIDGLGIAVNFSQITAGGGAYLFSNLVPGSYKVTFSNLPASYVFTAQDVGANGFDTVDSDANTTTGATGNYTLVSGDSNLTVDAGAYLPASLGNFVWNDLNGNGKQDGGEPGINGVTATLTGIDGLGNAVNLSQITAGGGAYLFNNLVPGSYKVTFSNLPASYVFTAQDVGANGFDTVDSDANTTTGATGNYTLVSGDSNLTVDAGAYLPASLGNFVWNDLNGNGKQDGGEPGINGVTATLTGIDGLGNAVNFSQITAGGGAYLFSNLVPGSYKVTFSNLPASYVFTAQDVGANGFDTVDSDANTTTGATGNYTLVSGDSNLTVDAGAYLPASLGNFVWNDLNGNGKQDGGEPGINGVTATLTGIDGLGNAVNLSQITAGGGAYLFSNLVPGSYKVTFSNLPASYVFTAQDVGANGFDTVDSDANTTTGATGNYTLVSGDSNLTVDAGAYLPASLGNFVWNDLNGNGKQDGGEPGINGVTATLTGTDGLGNAVNLSQITAGGGAYLFNNLVPGSYKVTFSNLPASYVFTAQDVGANGFDTVDSDANTTTGATGNYTLVSGDSNLTVDAGAYLPAAIGDFVWLDKNANGQQDIGEPGLDGLTVKLLDASGFVLFTTVTGDNPNVTGTQQGYYEFKGLTPGSYAVQFFTGAGYDKFTDLDIGLDGTDSDMNVVTGKTALYTLASGDFNQTVDAGLKPIDLSLTKTVNNAGPTIGSNVTFTLTVNNASGFSTATGVAVRDVLPAGLTFVSSTATQGAYASNIWTIGTLTAGQTVTLTITATVATGGTKTNYAEVYEANQIDINSTPNNNSTTEDDDDQVLIIPVAQLISKIDIEKTTNGTPNSNSVVPDYDNEDAPNGAGVPILTAGNAVSWTYKVTNTGTVAFATSDIVIVDDNGTPSVTTDDMSIANGKITFASVAIGNADNILDPNEVWLYRATGLVQTVVVPGTGASTTIDFQGNTALDGTDGNTMTFSSGGISVKASAFSRSDAGVWSTAYLGSYGGGLGVTDALDGTGASDTHTVDNLGGSDNYVLFEFSQYVILDSAALGYVVGDSDMTVWIGSKANPFANHAAILSDAYLNSLGFTEVNLGAGTTRVADLNSVNYAGNVLIIAAKVDESTNDDRFKIQNVVLKSTTPAVYENKAVINVPNATDFDLSHYKNPSTPAIDIEKTTNGPSNANPIAPDYDNEDAVNGAGVPVLSPDSAVTWTYKVTNTGNVTFTTSDISIVDDNGTPTITTDDFSIANGKITFASVSVGDTDNLLEPGEVWLYQTVGTVQTVLIPGTAASTTIDFQGNTALDGTEGTILSFSSGGISVKASAFTRSDAGAWSTAYLGSYGGGLGVTDALDGTGANDTHTVDNMGGSDNYVLLEFSQSVIVDAANLGYVVGDSDMTVWIGTKSDVFNNHLTLSDAVLSSLGFTEVNLGGSTTRLADLNATNLAGNVLVIASKVDETTNDDRFKIQNVVLKSTVGGIYENKGVITVPGATDFDLSHYKNPDPTLCVDITTTGNSAVSGTAGNMLTFGSGNISFKASAFSRTDAAPNTWNTAFLGSFAGGLGVTDGSETGAGDTHTVDNAGGRDNYVLFEFSQSVLIDKAFLGYVVGDSDITVWIGTKNDPFTNHLTLSDSLLSSLAFTEDNTTTLTSARTADINAKGVVGNVLVIAAQASDTSPEDYFKISGLKVCTPAKTKFFVANDSTTTGVVDRTYEYATGGTADENYALNTANTAPRGATATAAGDKVWVVDANSKVYVYNNSGGLLGSWTATLPTGAKPEGIATNGTDIWIVTSDGSSTGRNTATEKVFRFSGATSGTGASRLSGTQTPVSSFALNVSNLNPKDLVTDGTSIWVVNDAASGDKVFKYDLAGTCLGSWMIDAGNTSPTGITLDPANVGNLWIVDNGTKRIYQYNAAASLTSGTVARPATTSFALSAGNTNPQGIADPPVWDASAGQEVQFDAGPAVSPMYNAELPTDVNGDGVTTPLDALLVVNQLNGRATQGSLYHDVNNDGVTSPVDALLVVNYLDAVRNSGTQNLGSSKTAAEQVFAEMGEGEGAVAFDELYADVATQWGKSGRGLFSRREGRQLR